MTPDAELAGAAAGLGVVVVDEPAAGARDGVEPGLDAAVLAGTAHARTVAPTAPVAVVLGDLPRLDPADLDAALTLAARHERAHVSDTDGTGTTLLTAAPRCELRPRFGAGSSRRHAEARHVRLDVPQASTLRHDMDGVADLVTCCPTHSRGPSLATIIHDRGRR